MHQILKFRSFDGKPPVEAGFGDKITVQNLSDILQNPQAILERYDDKERYNIVCTIASVKNMKGRVFVSQDVIPLDIDHVDSSMLKDVFHNVCSTLMLDPKKTAAIATGNGLHIFIKVPTWNNKEYFDNNRKAYKAMTTIVQDSLRASALPGELDTNIFSPGFTTRVPGSYNDKTHKGGGRKLVTIISKGLELQDFDLSTFKSLSDIQDEVEKSVGGIDKEEVLSCGFLKFCKEHPESVKEPSWFAMLGVLAFLPDGDKLCHEYSALHPGYTHAETEKKYQQALKATGPRTCRNIETLFDGCKDCKHYQQITSPLQAKGETFIETEKTGFHKQIITKQGMLKTVPVPQDLVKKYNRDHPYVTEPSGAIYKAQPPYHVWKLVSEVELNEFATKHYKPAADNGMRTEFRGELASHNVVRSGHFQDASRGFLNLKNGVLNLKTLELLPHSPSFNFMYVLDYDYEPDATCPEFDKALDTICCQDKELVAIFWEYLGYIISGDANSRFEKALILVGGGSNGKSTLIRVITDLVGEENCCSCSINSLKNPQVAQNLRGKLANLVPEMESDDFDQSAYFKSLVSGEPQSMKILYAQPFSESIGAKFVMLCNTLPTTRDWTHGMMRRLLVLPMHHRFVENKGNFDRDIVKNKFKAERAGILNQAIKGYIRLNKQDSFTQSKVSQIVIDEYRDLNDSVRQWAMDHIEVNYAYLTPISEVYKNYHDYCRAMGLKPVALPKFGARLHEYDSSIQTERTTKNKMRVNNYRGVKLVGGSYDF